MVQRSSVVVDEVDGVPSIPAASAIAGSIAASNDLPYMTPPIHANHFSGDSQDSTSSYQLFSIMSKKICDFSQIFGKILPNFEIFHNSPYSFSRISLKFSTLPQNLELHIFIIVSSKFSYIFSKVILTFPGYP